MRGRLFPLALAALSLASCYRGEGTENPGLDRGGPFLPWGVVQPATPGEENTGVYRADTHRACCLLDRQAVIYIHLRRNATRMRLDFYAIDTKADYGADLGPQSITATFPDGESFTSGPIPRAFKTVNFALPAALRGTDRIVPVTLTMAYSFTPSYFHPGEDAKRYSIVLRGVSID